MVNFLLHKFYVTKPRSQKVLTSFDNSILIKQIVIQRDEPESVEQPLPSPKEETVEDLPGQQRVQDAIKRLEDYIIAAEQMKSLIADKLKNRVVCVNEKENLTLKQAIARVFGIDSDKVTFDMFQKCLAIRSKLFGGKSTNIEEG